MKAMIVALILGPMVFLGNDQLGTEGKKSSIPSVEQEGAPPAIHRVVVVHTPYGVRVVPGILSVRHVDRVMFKAVNGEFKVTLPFDDNTTLEIPPTKIWEVPDKLEPGYYEYEVTEPSAGLKGLGNSAPVIIIEPD